MLICFTIFHYESLLLKLDFLIQIDTFQEYWKHFKKFFLNNCSINNNYNNSDHCVLIVLINMVVITTVIIMMKCCRLRSYGYQHFSLSHSLSISLCGTVAKNPGKLEMWYITLTFSERNL